MNEERKEQWLSVLEITNIDKRHYDKVLSYIDMYLVTENLYGTIDVKILPLSLQIFSCIDLDKVDIIAYPMDVDNGMIEMSNGFTNINIVNEISQIINTKLEIGFRVKVYRILQSIKKVGNKTQIHFRFKIYK